MAGPYLQAHFFAEEQSGEQTDGEWVHLAITLAGHPISGTGTIYLGDDDRPYGESPRMKCISIARQQIPLCWQIARRGKMT
jgi:hypothetical protein